MHLIGSLILVVLLLILWFCLALKTSWRFRLIHAQKSNNETTTCTPLSTLPSNERYNFKNFEKQQSEYDIYAQNHVNSTGNLIMTESATQDNNGLFGPSNHLNSYVLVKPNELGGDQGNNFLRVNPIIDHNSSNSTYNTSKQTRKIRPSPLNETVSSYDSPRMGRFNNAHFDTVDGNPYASLSSLQNQNRNGSVLSSDNNENGFITKLKLSTNNQNRDNCLPKPVKRGHVTYQQDMNDAQYEINRPKEPFSSVRESPLNAYRAQEQENLNLILPLAKEKISYEELCSQV